MKGAYVLIIRVRQPVKLQIKSLGEQLFEAGVWVYVGSAMGDGSTSLENRLNRHFRKEKTVYWHIDHLLDNDDTELTEALWAESIAPFECDLAQAIGSIEGFFVGVRGFGSSDCRKKCPAHIYFYQGEELVHEKLIQVFLSLGFQPKVTNTGRL